MDNSKNEASPVSKARVDDELSLDLVTFVRRHVVILLGGTLIGGALGLAVAFALPAQWEVNALIRVGKIGELNFVEPPRMAVIRTTQKPFRDGVLKRMGISPDGSNPKVDLLFSSLKVKIDESDLIGVSVRGTTPDDTVRFVEALIVELADAHARMMEPTITHWRKELDEINLELELTRKELEQMSRRPNRLTSLIDNKNTYQVPLAITIHLSRVIASSELQKQKYILQKQLSPQQTFPTISFGQIEVSEQPVFPNKSILATSGLVIGLLIGILLALWRSSVSVDKNGWPGDVRSLTISPSHDGSHDNK